MPHYFVRVGVLAEVQLSHSESMFGRGNHVIVRSARGLEIGEVLNEAKHVAETSSRILRIAGAEDELLIRRLQRHKRRAIEKCRQDLRIRSPSATLLEIDHLFDGRSIVLHFLGNVDLATESHIRKIAADYESVVRTGPLAKLLSEGCGEGCGTSESKGCGGNCIGCSIASVCHS